MEEAATAEAATVEELLIVLDVEVKVRVDGGVMNEVVWCGGMGDVFFLVVFVLSKLLASEILLMVGSEEARATSRMVGSVFVEAGKSRIAFS